MPFLWLLLGFGGGYVVGWQVRDKEPQEGSGAQPLPFPPGTFPTLPPPRQGPIGQFPGMLGVPPSPVPIPGGSFIQGVGYCPPGMVYDLSSKLCVPQFSTQGTGACCGSCELGGPCEGCDE